MASCLRPSERASVKVSCNCSGRTPATGMSRMEGADAGGAEGAVESPPRMVCVCGDAAGVAVASGAGEAAGVSVAVGVGVSVAVGVVETASADAPGEGRAMGVTGRVPYAVLRYQTSAATHAKMSAAMTTTRARGLKGMGCFPLVFL
jgi:hypothetical protein